MNTEKITIEVDLPYCKTEDGGSALIGELYPINDEDEESGMFVRLQSWEDNPDLPGAHKQLQSLVGQRLRITIESLGTCPKEVEQKYSQY